MWNSADRTERPQVLTGFPSELKQLTGTEADLRGISLTFWASDRQTDRQWLYETDLTSVHSTQTHYTTSSPHVTAVCFLHSLETFFVSQLAALWGSMTACWHANVAGPMSILTPSKTRLWNISANHVAALTWEHTWDSGGFERTRLGCKWTLNRKLWMIPE